MLIGYYKSFNLPEPVVMWAVVNPGWNNLQTAENLSLSCFSLIPNLSLCGNFFTLHTIIFQYFLDLSNIYMGHVGNIMSTYDPHRDIPGRNEQFSIPVDILDHYHRIHRNFWFRRCHWYKFCFTALKHYMHFDMLKKIKSKEIAPAWTLPESRYSNIMGITSW